MNRHLVPLVIVALLALPMAVAAQQGGHSVASGSGIATPEAPAKVGDKARPDPTCLKQTGSRIVPRKDKQGRCALGPGRVYTSDDIARTGETSVGDALRKLDPSIH